jgi:hypothetical protein
LFEFATIHNITRDKYIVTDGAILCTAMNHLCRPYNEYLLFAACLKVQNSPNQLTLFAICTTRRYDVPTFTLRCRRIRSRFAMPNSRVACHAEVCGQLPLRPAGVAPRETLSGGDNVGARGGAQLLRVTPAGAEYSDTTTGGPWPVSRPAPLRMINTAGGILSRGDRKRWRENIRADLRDVRGGGDN